MEVWIPFYRWLINRYVILFAKGMNRGFMGNQQYWLLFLVIFFGGCATGKPMSWIENGTSLSNYKVFEVADVSNETGKVYDFDIVADLTKKIKLNVAHKGYLVAEDSAAGESAIVLKSSLTLYEPGSALKRWVYGGYGATQCTVISSLIDKKTGKTIGEIQVAKTISQGGLYSIGADIRILDIVASDIAEEIDKIIKE